MITVIRYRYGKEVLHSVVCPLNTPTPIFKEFVIRGEVFLAMDAKEEGHELNVECELATTRYQLGPNADEFATRAPDTAAA